MIPHDERIVFDFGLWHIVTSERHDGLEFHVHLPDGALVNLDTPKDGVIGLAGVLLCWLSQNGMTDSNVAHFTGVANGVAEWREQIAKHPEFAESIRKAMGKIL